MIMKTLNTIGEVRELINRENYHFANNEFEDFFDLKTAAEEHFKSITENFEDRRAYYKAFGLKVWDVHLEKVKEEKYFIDEVNTVVTVNFYEGYIDSGVANEYYFHGYSID